MWLQLDTPMDGANSIIVGNELQVEVDLCIKRILFIYVMYYSSYP